jgi:membrane associated rhomboid family serine protease
MLIPWDTDAPCYHFPWATIGLIILNVLLFGALVAAEGEGFDEWILEFGNGLHPLQWISTHFLHADIMHLVGNMIFLWAFGLVVEGKLGWKIFLPLYLAMGLTYGLIIQIVMSEADGGGALGASGVI